MILNIKNKSRCFVIFYFYVKLIFTMHCLLGDLAHLLEGGLHF